MKTAHHSFLIAAIFTAAGLAAAQAETKTLHYPTEDKSMFTIESPADWEVTGIDEVGEFGSLESKNGSILQFRAVECESEAEAKAELDSISESTTEFLQKNYTDIKLGEVEELEIQGVPGFSLSGSAKDKDGDDVALLTTTIVLGPLTIAEVWAAVYPDDLSAAKTVLGSFKPTGPAKAK